MATRPVFVPVQDEPSLVKEIEIEFEWHPGFSTKQKRKSVRSLHRSARRRDLQNVLEISTKSESELGQSLSAFNLLVGKNPDVSVESAYQGSKVFEHGGPYKDLYEKKSLEAKKDDRLKNSGDLIAFNLKGQEWPLEPKTAFYNWLYLRALNQYKGRIEKLLKYDGFTDIEFNPDRSVNCQARAVAMGVALRRSEYLEEAIRSKESFIQTLRKGIPEEIRTPKQPEKTPDLFSANSSVSSVTNAFHLTDDVLRSVIESITEEIKRSSTNKKALQLLLVEVLCELRSEAGLTQKEIGKKIGVSRSTVSDLENAKSDPKLSVIIDYLDAVDAGLELTIHAGSDSISINFSDLVELGKEESQR